jgi:hypothetical protein
VSKAVSVFLIASAVMVTASTAIAEDFKRIVPRFFIPFV